MFVVSLGVKLRESSLLNPGFRPMINEDVGWESALKEGGVLIETVVRFAGAS